MSEDVSLWPQVGDPVKLSENNQLTLSKASGAKAGEFYVLKAEKDKTGQATGRYMLIRVDWKPADAEKPEE